MAPHVTHMGVHDHGFNNVSTYGALRRLALEGRYRPRRGSASSASWRSRRAAPSRRAAGRAPRTAAATSTPSTARTRCSPTRCARCARSRSRTGSATRCSGRDDRRSRCWSGCCSTRGPRPVHVYYGTGRDSYDVRGRVAHESIFNVVDGNYRWPEHAAGLLAVHHLDARAGLGACWGSPSSWSSSRRGRRGARAPRRAGRDRARDAGSALATPRHYLDATPFGRRAVLGHGRARPRAARATRDRPADPCNDHEPVD